MGGFVTGGAARWGAPLEQRDMARGRGGDDAAGLEDVTEVERALFAAHGALRARRAAVPVLGAGRGGFGAVARERDEAGLDGCGGGAGRGVGGGHGMACEGGDDRRVVYGRLSQGRFCGEPEVNGERAI